MITVFKNLYDKKPYYTTLPKIVEQIQNGPKALGLIEQIRGSKDENEIEELKKRLPVICFGGEFTERRTSALVKPSRLVCLDLDDVAHIKLRKKQLSELPFVKVIFISPTGTGLKIIVETSSDDYTAHWASLAKEITGVDPAAKDIARACFISYDEEIYYNESADIYAKKEGAKRTDDQKLELLKKWLSNKGEQFVSGNRNNFLSKLAGAANRFGLTREYVEKAFIRDFCQEGFDEREALSVINSMYSNYSQFHNTASFDEEYGEEGVTQILSDSVPTKDIIYLSDVEEDLIKDYELGTEQASTTYFPSIDLIFRPLRGDLNVLGGIGNHGKSAIKKQLDLVASVKEGRKHVYFSPEEYPSTFWYRELVRSYIGKPLEKDDKNRMSLEEYKRGMEFIREHFIYVYPPSLPTPEYILERFIEVIIKHSVDSVTIDPWNQLLHIMEKRDDIYLAETLSKFERFAKQHNVFFTIVAHPNRTAKKEDGNYECPDIYDLNGGPTWNARATNIVMYHRPFYGTDKSDTTAELHSKKIKRQMISGMPGMASLNYDRRTGRFFDLGFSPLM